MEFSGRLASFPLPAVLQWASQEACTGALVVRRSQREKRVYLQDGQVVGCASDDPREYLGQHLLVNGLLTQAQVVEALTYCRRTGKRLGVSLVELGILARETVQRALRQQVEDAVCDLFLWRHGVFYFQHEETPEEGLLPEPISTVGLAMEGARWVDEHDRIRSVFVHDNIALCRGRSWTDQGLPPLERRIARAVDRHKTLRDLYEEIRGSHFRFLKAAFDLTVREVLDIHDVGEETGTSSIELRVADLLLEQAAEEQVLSSIRYLALPLEVIERYYPVWVVEPAPGEQQRMPDWAMELSRSIDGRTTLASLFSEDRQRRGRELDFFLLHMKKGALALLPFSVEGHPPPGGPSGEAPPQGWGQRLADPTTRR